ncbi:MAG: glycosyltransferase [Pseudomonadota bacterium]
MCLVLPAPAGGNRTWDALGLGRLRNLIAPIRHRRPSVTVVLLGEADGEALATSAQKQLDVNVVVKRLSDVTTEKFKIKGKRFLHNVPFLQRSYQIYQHLRVVQYDVAIFDDRDAPGFVSIRARRTGTALQRTPILTLFHSVHELQRFRLATFPEDPLQEAQIDFAERYCVENSDVVLVDDWCVHEWAGRNGWEIPEDRVRPLSPEADYMSAFHLMENPADGPTSTSIRASDGALGELPEVTVCIAHYRDTTNLGMALESLRKNDYSNFRVIIVDDGSTTPAVLEDLDRLAEKYSEPMFRFIKKGQNEGPGAARNLAAGLVADGLIIFMDSDNIAGPLMISSFVRGMVHSRADCLTCWFVTFRGDGQLCGEPDITFTPLGPCLELGIFENCFGDTNFCIKATVFRDLGGFINRQGFGLEDWHFLARLALRGYRLDVVPDELFFYRVRDEGWNVTAQSYANAGLARSAYFDILPPHLKKLARDVTVPLMIQQYARKHSRTAQAVNSISSFLRSNPRIKKVLARYYGLLASRVGSREAIRLARLHGHLCSLRTETIAGARRLKRIVKRGRLKTGGTAAGTGHGRISLEIRDDWKDRDRARGLEEHVGMPGVSLRQEGDLGRPDYVYAPSDHKAALSGFDLMNVLLCLNHIDYDFVTIAADLSARADEVSAPVADHIISRGEDTWLRNGGQPPAAAGPRVGRRLRLMPHRGQTVSLDSAVPTRVRALNSHELVVGDSCSATSGAASPARRNSQGVEFMPARTSGRPVVFVLPTHLAVGGVERNTAAIISKLKGLIDFAVINSDTLSPKRGSLHHQFVDHVVGLYDLAELGSPYDYLPMLASLKRVYQPSLIWICNGSTWLCDYAKELRSLFPDVPIVDQQVYDTKHGWINRYHEKGIQSFDRFIAINQRIEEVFTGRLGMSRDRIDLIYHAIDAERFRPMALSPQEESDRRKEYGIPAGRPVFAFIGRLTAQKRPMAFVNLAKWMRILRDESFFVMIGDGEMAAEVEESVERYGLDNVRRIPFVEDMSRILPLFSGLVITSDFEGLPIAMIEALACGVPVLSTDVGDVKVLLETHGSGLVVSVPADGRDFSDCFMKWKQQLPGYRAAARASAEEVRQRFGSGNVSRLYVECWNRASLDVRKRPLL